MPKQDNSQCLQWAVSAEANEGIEVKAAISHAIVIISGHGAAFAWQRPVELTCS